MATSTMMLLPLCTRKTGCQPGRGRGQAAGRAEGTYLGQEGGDEDEEDVVDEEHQQQQRAGLWEPGPEWPQLDLCSGPHPWARMHPGPQTSQGACLRGPRAASP